MMVSFKLRSWLAFAIVATPLATFGADEVAMAVGGMEEQIDRPRTYAREFVEAALKTIE